MPADDSRREVKSVATSCRLIYAMQKRGTATVSELADAVDHSVGSVHTHLATLKQFGFVVQEGSEYKLGPHLVPLAEHVKHRSPLYRAAKEEVDRLATETGECVHLIIENNGRSIILYEAFGEDAIGTRFHTRSREKTDQPLHAQAAGKTILAHLPADRVEAIVDEHGLTSVAENTITDVDELYDQLETIRSRGYALNDQEEIRGIRAVGAPILARDGRPLGAISITAPSTRLEGELFTDEYPKKVIDTANIVEINLETDEYTLDSP